MNFLAQMEIYMCCHKLKIYLKLRFPGLNPTICAQASSKIFVPKYSHQANLNFQPCPVLNFQPCLTKSQSGAGWAKLPDLNQATLNSENIGLKLVRFHAPSRSDLKPPG